jgi:DNA-binding NtrC family response regulator
VETEFRMNRGLHTVLIVADDLQASYLLEEMLGSRNLRLLVAHCAAPALEICERESVHLVISDLPASDGTRLVDRLLRLQPEARALLISPSQHASGAPASDRIGFLRKPFFPSQLIEQVKPLLSERSIKAGRAYASTSAAAASPAAGCTE